MKRTTRWGLPAVAALAAPALTPAAPAAADPAMTYCYTEALTVDEVEDGAVSEVTCYEEEQPMARSASMILAEHFSGRSGIGTILTVWGTTCTNATISFNVFDPWNNLIKSTRHYACGNAKHFVNNDFTGYHELTQGPPGLLNDLSNYLGDHVSSVGYG